jgi:hypothetical protein
VRALRKDDRTYVAAFQEERGHAGRQQGAHALR